MRGGTVCSGIGAPEVAAPWIDWRWCSEIEAFPSAVLAHHRPDVPNLGDMTQFAGWPDDEAHAIDILVGGTPCQSFSVAGLRKGMADPRGNLALTYLAIAARYRPRWLVWENVPGVLSSSGGRDFGSFLGGLGQLGYGFAYRVLDAQFVRTCGFSRAVPQRRRRVFVVGYSGDWRRAAAVLFDGESLSGNPPPRREAGQVAPTVPSRSTGGGGLGTDFDCDGGLIRTYAMQERMESLNPDAGPNGKGWRDDGCAFTLEARHRPQTIASTGDVAHCLNAGGMGRQDYETETMVAHSLRGEGFDASEDGTGRGTPIVPLAFSSKDDLRDLSENVCGTLRTGGKDGGPINHAVAFDLNQITSKANRSQPDPTVHHTLPATTCPPHLASPWAVRRLTPRECERLQGFPDGFTDIPWRGKPHAPDGPRYKALGNSMAVNAMEWLLDGIRRVDAIQVAA